MSIQEIADEKKIAQRRRRTQNAMRCLRYRRKKTAETACRKHVTKKGVFFHDYDSLIAAIVHARRALGLSQLAMDQLSGLPDGYQGKLEAKVKSLGPTSLPKVLDTLGLDMALIPRRSPKRAT